MSRWRYFSPSFELRKKPLFFNWWYNLLCKVDIGHLSTVSTLSGSSLSTSFFRRLSKNGLSTLCKRLIIRSDSSSFNSTFSPVAENGVLNQSSKFFTELKIFGKTKLRIAHNSGKLFYHFVSKNSTRKK